MTVPLTCDGQIDLSYLEGELQEYAARPLMIGSFSAASNVTGVKSDILQVTSVLKKHGALAFWDYAAAAPYVAIDMNGEVSLDAAFISPHKFIGGPGAPGVLVVKDAILTNDVPAVVGGGTVKYVTPERHVYIEDHEAREEGGTPAIVESVRAGLVYQVQSLIGAKEIERLEDEIVRKALARLRPNKNLDILGNLDADRLSIFSLRFLYAEKDLHFGFVAALLNDLFGIQVRGGCSCAGAQPITAS